MDRYWIIWQGRLHPESYFPGRYDGSRGCWDGPPSHSPEVINITKFLTAKELMIEADKRIKDYKAKGKRSDPDFYRVLIQNGIVTHCNKIAY